MQAEDFISLPDILRAVALLRNANVPMIKDRYACVIDSAGIQQLALGDSRFGDRVEAFKDSKQRVLSAGDTIDYAGVLFKVQDITVTGNHITCALRFPVQCLVMRRDYGLNLAYVSAFDEVPGDLPDEDAE